ncbi:MAG: sigma factor [Candidatus Binatia bacterium]|nr:sigma factor [Candidatus Binatia bacterium]MDG1959628.1 sigma factor [Candidatus Binatia bacterium]MDG2010311.1 sigma factor [Candidatus Binatia bacterium]
MDLDQVYRESAPFLRGVGYRVCGDVSVAEDLLQETFLRALEQMTSAPPERDDLLGIFIRLAVPALQSRRSRSYAGRWLPMPVQTDLGGVGVPDAVSANATLGFDSLLALEELEAQARAIFVLGEIAGHSLPAIAEIFALPLEAVELSLVDSRLALERDGRYPTNLAGSSGIRTLVEGLATLSGSGAFSFPRDVVAPRLAVAFDHGGTCNAPDNQSCSPGAAANLLQGLLNHGKAKPEVQTAEVNFEPALLAEIGESPEGEAERLAILFGREPSGMLSRIHVVLAPAKLRALSFDGLRPSLGELL